MKLLITLSILLNSITTFSQITEQKLINKFRKIDYRYECLRAHPSIGFSDSLVKANVDFQNTLLEFGLISSTITANLINLKKAGVIIANSPDQLFRVYSWDTKLGGSMHIYYNVYQYKVNSKTYTKIISDGKFEAGKWYSKISCLKVLDKIYYLGINHSIISSSHCLQGIKVFNISNRILNNHSKLIKTKGGFVDSLSIYFDFFSVMHRKERPVELIIYDNNTQTIKMTVVGPKYKVTNKFTSYKFNDSYFLSQ